MEREMKFGRMLGIANVLSQRVFEKGKPSISPKYWDRFDKNPADAITKIHHELMGYSHKFDETEWHLMDMLGEVLADTDLDEFTSESLKGKHLHAYYTQQHALNNVIGVEEASELWRLSPGTIKNYCAEEKIQAKKIGKTWVIDKNQPNPKKSSE